MADWAFADEGQSQLPAAQQPAGGNWAFADEDQSQAPQTAAGGDWSFADEQQPQDQPQTSALGAGLGEAALAVPRVLGATVGGLAGGVAGIPLGPAGIIGGGLAGGLAGGAAGETAKDWVTDKLGLSEGISKWERAAQEQHPLAAGAGELAPWLLGGEAGAGSQLVNRGVSASIAGLGTAGAELASGDGLHPGEILENMAVGAALPGQRKWASNLEGALQRGAGRVSSAFIPKGAANKADTVEVPDDAAKEWAAAQPDEGQTSGGVVQIPSETPAPPDVAAVLQSENTEAAPPVQEQAEMSSETGQTEQPTNQPGTPTEQPHPAVQAAVDAATADEQQTAAAAVDNAPKVSAKDHPAVIQAVEDVLSKQVPIIELPRLPSIANSGPRGVYVDASLPQEYRPFVAIHEVGEKALMDAGHSYDDAHNAITEVELNEVKKAGIDPAAYKKWFADNRARIEAQPWNKNLDRVYGFHEPVEDAIGHHTKEEGAWKDVVVGQGQPVPETPPTKVTAPVTALADVRNQKAEAKKAAELPMVKQRYEEMRSRLLPPVTKDIPPHIAKAIDQLGRLGFDRRGDVLKALREDIRAGKDPRERWDIQPQDEVPWRRLMDYVKTPFEELPSEYTPPATEGKVVPLGKEPKVTAPVTNVGTSAPVPTSSMGPDIARPKWDRTRTGGYSVDSNALPPFKDVGNGYAARQYYDQHGEVRQEIRTPEGNKLVRGTQHTDGRPYEEMEMGSSNPMGAGSMDWVERAREVLGGRARTPKVTAPVTSNSEKPTLRLPPGATKPEPNVGTPAKVPTSSRAYVTPGEVPMGAEPPGKFAHPALSEQDQALLKQVTERALKQNGPEWVSKFQKQPIETQLAAARSKWAEWTQAAKSPEEEAAAARAATNKNEFRETLGEDGEGPQTGGGERGARKRSATNAWNQVFQKYGTPAGQLDPRDKAAALSRATAAVKEAADVHGSSPLDPKTGYHPNEAPPERKWLEAASKFVKNPDGRLPGGKDAKGNKIPGPTTFQNFMEMHAGAGQLARDPDRYGELAKKRRPTVENAEAGIGGDAWATGMGEPRPGKFPKPDDGEPRSLTDIFRNEEGAGPGIGAKTPEEKAKATLAFAARRQKQKYEEQAEHDANETQRDFKGADNAVAQVGQDAFATFSKIAKDQPSGKLLAATGQKLYRAFEPHGDEIIKKFTPEEKAIYDKIRPVYDAMTRDYAELHGMRPDLDMPALSDGYMRQIHAGTRRWDEGVDPITGRGLTERSLAVENAALIDRKFMVAEDQAGNRILLAKGDEGSKNEGHYFAWKNGKMVDLGEAYKGFKFHPGETLRFNDTDYKLTFAQAREVNEHARINPKENNGSARYKIHEDPFTSIMEGRTLIRRALEHQKILNNIVGNRALNDKGLPWQKGDTRMGPSEMMKPYMSSTKKEGFEESTLPQVRGYYFSPHIKEALDDFHRAGFGSWGALDTIEEANRRLTKLMFLSPIFHGLNDLVLWGTRQGFQLANPVHWWHQATDIPEAVKEVTTQGDVIKRIQEARGSLEFQSALHRDIMADTARLSGILPEMKTNIGRQAINGIYDLSSGSMWYANDVMYTNLFITATKRMGMTDRKAVDWVEKIFPNYQTQRRIFGSRFVAKALADSRIFNFGRYHGGILKQYESVFGDVVKAVKDQDPEAAKRAAGYLFGSAVMAYVVQNAMLNPLAQLASGDPNASIGYKGNLTIPMAIADALTGAAGDQSYTKAGKDIFSMAPIPRAALDLAGNEDFAGRKIMQPEDLSPFSSDNRTAGERVRDLGRAGVSAAEHTASQLVSPVSTAESIEGRMEQGQDALRQLSDYMLDIKTPSPKTLRYQAKLPAKVQKNLKFRERHPRGILEHAYDWATGG